MWITPYSWICIKKIHSVQYFMTIYTSRPRTSSHKRIPQNFSPDIRQIPMYISFSSCQSQRTFQQVNASNTHSFTEIAMATKYPTSNLPGWKELQLCFWIGECAVYCTVPSILCYTCLTLKGKGQVRDGNLFICCILVDSNDKVHEYLEC